MATPLPSWHFVRVRIMPISRTNPGGFRNKVEIQAKTETRNSKGEVVQTWATVATRRMRIENVKAKGTVAGDQAKEIASHKFLARNYYDLTSNHRFKVGDRSFGIEHVARSNEIDAEMEVTVKEVTP